LIKRREVNAPLTSWCLRAPRLDDHLENQELPRFCLLQKAATHII
jgi:hypothetical protein